MPVPAFLQHVAVMWLLGFAVGGLVFALRRFPHRSGAAWRGTLLRSVLVATAVACVFAAYYPLRGDDGGCGDRAAGSCAVPVD